jgi:hypothetical protein
MAKTLKFDERAFRRGVDDVFTLRPLRQAVKSFAKMSAAKRGKTTIAVSRQSGASSKKR